MALVMAAPKQMDVRVVPFPMTVTMPMSMAVRMSMSRSMMFTMSVASDRSMSILLVTMVPVRVVWMRVMMSATRSATRESDERRASQTDGSSVQEEAGGTQGGSVTPHRR